MQAKREVKLRSLLKRPSHPVLVTDERVHAFTVGVRLASASSNSIGGAHEPGSVHWHELMDVIASTSAALERAS